MDWPRYLVDHAGLPHGRVLPSAAVHLTTADLHTGHGAAVIVSGLMRPMIKRNNAMCIMDLKLLY